MFLVLVVILLAPQPEIRKQYLCHGVTPTGSYDVVLIIEKKEDNYLLTWITNEIKARGIGLRVDDTLTALFVNPKNEGGVIHFKITKVGLEGSWAMGSGKVYTETCSLGPVSKA